VTATSRVIGSAPRHATHCPQRTSARYFASSFGLVKFTLPVTVDVFDLNENVATNFSPSLCVIFNSPGSAGSIIPDQASAQLGFLFGRFSLGLDGIVGIAAVIPVLAALTAITSRLTVRRFLSQTSGL